MLRRSAFGRVSAALVAAILVSGASCAAKMNARQEMTYEAFYACRSEGPSTLLQRVDPEGNWYVEGREGEVFKVSSCMSQYVDKAMREGRVR